MYLKIKFDNDRVFKENDFSEMKSRTYRDFSGLPEIKRNNYYSVAENTVKKTTIGCILDIPEDKKVTALNFANAMFAGGGYVLGGNAQEESLCRASMLYYTLKTQKEYYRRNRLHILPDYTDTVIYSENVPIIRNEKGVLLEKRRNCNFITVPAVNRTFAKFMFSDRKINEKMQKRIEMLLGIAVENRPNVLVLGAFGCGVFGNKREVVFKIFEEVINRGVPENIEVIFAVP